MKTILIIEPLCSGHHMNYVYWIVKEAIKRNYKIQLATLTGCLNHPLLQDLLRVNANNITIIRAPKNIDICAPTYIPFKSVKLAHQECYYYKLFSILYAESCKLKKPDIVLIPTLDYCTNLLAILKSPFDTSCWAGIVMRPTFHLSSKNIIGPHNLLQFIKKHLFFRLLKRQYLCTLFTIDETLPKYISDHHPIDSEKLVYLPDPTQLIKRTSSYEAKKLLKIPTNALVLLVYGAIRLNKGIAELLSATNNQALPNNVHILLAGKQNADVRKLLLKSNFYKLLEMGRLHQLDFFLSADQENLVFSAADIVWLGYKDHYSTSAVLVQAGRLGLPIIACNVGLISWLTKQYDLGLQVDIRDSKAITMAIETLASDNKLRRSYHYNSTQKFAKNTVPNFTDIIFRALSFCK